MPKNSLSSPTPGGKAIDSSNAARYFTSFGGQRFSRICDRPGSYDTLLDVYLGGGGVAFGHPHGCSHVITSDVNPGVLALAECWGDARLRLQVEQAIQAWKDLVIGVPQKAFADLRDSYHNIGQLPVWGQAAAFLTIKRLVFGGVLRCNKQGDLNVALSVDKLDKFLNSGKGKGRRKICSQTPALYLPTDSPSDDYWGWRYEWPDNGVKTLDVHHGWQGAVQALADSDYDNALVVIDPPYYSPKEWIEVRKDGTERMSRMTPAYTHHAPQSESELAMCVDCLDAVLATGKAGRIVVFNYWSEELDAHLLNTCIQFGLNGQNLPKPFHSSNLGPLGSMNNSQKFHGRDNEVVYEIGGRRMFQDVSAAKQGDLLEVLAK